MLAPSVEVADAVATPAEGLDIEQLHVAVRLGPVVAVDISAGEDLRIVAFLGVTVHDADLLIGLSELVEEAIAAVGLELGLLVAPYVAIQQGRVVELM